MMRIVPADSSDSSIVAAPAFAHTLRFLDPLLEDSFQLFLRDKARSGFALYPSLLERYAVFGLLFVLNLGVTAGSYVVDTVSFGLSEGALVIQLAGMLMLACIGLISTWVSYRLRHRPIANARLLILLCLVTCCACTVLDTSLAHKLISGTTIQPTLTGLVPVLVTLMAMQYIFTGEFCLFAVAALVTVIVYLAAHLAVQDRGVSSVIIEFLILLLCGCFLVRRLFTMEKGLRVAFLLDQNETAKVAHRSSKSSYSAPANSSYSQSTEREELINRMNSIHAAITDACAVVTFQDIRARLKSALRDLDLASSKLSQPGFSLVPRTERIHHDLDEEDRVFVQQNFMATKASDYASQAGPATQREVVTMDLNLEYGLSELLSILNQLGRNWNFDMFFLHEITKGKPLSVTGRFCLSKFDLSEKFGIAENTAANFFSALEAQYKDNPYHNSIHGADVLGSVFFMYNRSYIMGHLTDVEILAAVIATLGHDAAHGALTNRFLVNSRDGLAITCKSHIDNDISVLEMMHASLTFSLLQVEDQNILKTLDNDSWMLTRKIVLKMILATDMSRHFELLGAFRATHSFVNPSQISKIDDRITVSEMCIKAADIGHAGKALDLHERWTLLVCEEFFQQGDLEKKLGLPVSMYCDRETTDIAKVRRR